MLVGVFFLKQKTAYEMRISDWSSDVCSSDLARPRAVEPREGLDGFLAQMFGDAGAVVGDLDFNVSLAAAQPHLDLAPEAQRIAEQVEKRALHCDAMDREHQMVGPGIADVMHPVARPVGGGRAHHRDAGRSEERRVGNECYRECRSRWGPD